MGGSCRVVWSSTESRKAFNQLGTSAKKSKILRLRVQFASRSSDFGLPRLQTILKSFPAEEAAWREHRGVVALLLERGANMDARACVSACVNVLLLVLVE